MWDKEKRIMIGWDGRNGKEIEEKKGDNLWKNFRGTKNQSQSSMHQNYGRCEI